MSEGAGGMVLGSILLADAIAPTLSNPQDGTPTSDGATGASVDSNEGNGTLYWAVLTDGGSCTNAQLKAGSGGNIVAGKAGNQAVSASGTQTIPNITGLTAGTNYELVWLQRDAAGNDSSQATTGLTTTGGASVTWNPSDKAAGITLSGGDLTAAMASSNNYVACGVRATASLSGKKYFRCVLADLTGTDAQLGVGVATVGASLAAAFPTTSSVVCTGTDAATIASLAEVKANNTYVIDGVGAVVATDIVDVAVDVPNLKVWFRKNGTGNWNASGTANPATNTEGVAMDTGTWYPFFAGMNGTGVTARFADDASGTAPSGFSWVG